MINFNKITLMHVFQLLLGLSVLISLYMFIVHAYDRNYKKISCWRFPMLLAIFLETFMS